MIEIGLTSNGVDLTPATAPGYQRAVIADPQFTTAHDGMVENTVAIEFPIATGSWPTVDGFAVFQSGDPNALFTGPLTVMKTVEACESVSFPVGSMRVSFDDLPSDLEIEHGFTLTIELNSDTVDTCRDCANWRRFVVGVPSMHEGKCANGGATDADETCDRWQSLPDA